MRDKLKKFNWHIHPLSDQDIDHAYGLVKEMLSDRRKALDGYRTKVEKENPQSAMDIMDDVGYYHGLDNQVLWQMAIWRLQGIFEGMIILRYLEDFSLSEKLIGLKAKLEAMKVKKYSIDPNDYDELLEWSKLRNAISHCPPNWYGYIDLKEDDILEYIALIKRVTSKWNTELESRKSLP